MTRGVNKVILLGNLGDEPSFRQTNNGTAVANISLCTSDYYSDQTGKKIEQSEWHRLVFWGKLAEIAHQFLHKGAKIYVEGKIQTRRYTDKQNVERSITEIVISEMQMLDSKNANNGNNANNGAYNNGGYNNANSYNSGNNYNNNSARPQQASQPQQGYNNGYAQNNNGNVYNNAHAQQAPQGYYQNAQPQPQPQGYNAPQAQQPQDDLPF